MILAEFSKFLQQHNEDLLTRKTTPMQLLHVWLKSVIYKNPKTNIDKIIHKEILFCENETGDYLIVGKSDSGRVLVSSLIKFAKSYDNYNQAKWLEMTERSFQKEENNG
jgi:hypothetical protein